MFVNRGLLHCATALRLANVANACGTGGPGTLHTKNPSWTMVDIKDVAQAFRLAVEKQLSGHQAFFIGSRYRYRANGERQTPVETRAELAAAGLGNVPEKPGFLQEWQAIATSERVEKMLGCNPRY
jgi:nucleoside-diphosphate-sugar epimerase